MIILLLFSLSVLMAATDLPDFSASLAAPFQRICIGLSPTVTDFKELYTATICGLNPSNTNLMWDFRNTGLYHLIVVSGAHLSFLATLVFMILSKTPTHQKVKSGLLWACLLIYALASGLNPPIVRALVGVVLMKLQRQNFLGWSPYTIVIGSGLLCLIVFPAWWTSLSFLMSWFASLAIVLPGSLFRKSLYCYVLMLLPMSAFQWNHPLTMVFNILLAPILGFIVLPFSLLPFFIPPLTFVSDFVWAAVSFIVQNCSYIVSAAEPYLHFPIWFAWILLFALHYSLHHYRTQFRRSEWLAG